MRRAGILVFSLGLVLLCVKGYAQEEKIYREIPALLQVTVETRVAKEINRTWTDSVTTANPDVNARLEEELTLMRREAAPYLDSEDKQLELTVSYRISGDSWASFLLVRRICVARRTQHIAFECLSFDMETGRELTLSDLFPPDSEAWAMLSDTLREALLSVYPGEERQPEAIDALCQDDAIKGMPFMVGTYQLMLPTLLERVLPGKHQILQTAVFYDKLENYLTQEAARQFDNRGFRVTALTFDDGPAGASTLQVVDALGRAGANGTFFIVGSYLNKYAECARRAADSGSLLGSHTMRHLYPSEIDREYALRDKEKFTALLRQATGVTPRVFRAPGGKYASYLDWGIGWPNIHWSCTSDDIDGSNWSEIAYRVIGTAKDLSIVLMHDSSAQTAKAMPKMLAGLRARHFLFATVEELLRMNGVPMEPDRSYHDGTGAMMIPRDGVSSGD